MKHFALLIAVFLIALNLAKPAESAAESERKVSGQDAALFARDNLVAWCIVPFDTKKRGPEERAEMLKRLGLKRLAYDWRAEHISTFDAEIAACKAHNIELTADRKSTRLNSSH